MLTISNTEVFGLERALRASGNAMTTGEINTLEDSWGAFCDWCESLPLFKELAQKPRGINA